MCGKEKQLEARFFSHPRRATRVSPKAFAGRSGIRAFDEEARYFSFGPVPALHQGSGLGWNGWSLENGQEKYGEMAPKDQVAWYLVLIFIFWQFLAWSDDTDKRSVALYLIPRLQKLRLQKSVSSQVGQVGSGHPNWPTCNLGYNPLSRRDEPNKYHQQ